MMSIESIDLTEDYKFNVTVSDGVNCFAAKLELTQEKITLTIVGEENDERSCSIGWKNMDKLVCWDMNATFVLHNLNFSGGISRTITRYPKCIGYFENILDVEYLVFLPTESYGSSEGFDYIRLYSDSINSWVGNTQKQWQIIDAYHKRESIFQTESLNELKVLMEDGSLLSIGYSLSVHHSSFSAGINLPLSLTLLFGQYISSSEIKVKFDELYSLISYFIGDDLAISRVDLGFDSHPSSKKGMLYYPIKPTLPKYGRVINFFPLGHNLRFDSLALPEVPLSSIKNYFSLEGKHKDYFKKLLKYRRMENDEDRFLGFFRILESLCSKRKSYLDEVILSDLIIKAKPYLVKKFGDKKNVKEFLKGIPRYNLSKYNTAKCIRDFYDEIPDDLTNTWGSSGNEISNICKLRNDITHANDYYVSERDLRQKTKFIEILLVLALGKAIGIELEDLKKVIDRVQGYFLIGSYDVGSRTIA